MSDLQKLAQALQTAMDELGYDTDEISDLCSEHIEAELECHEHWGLKVITIDGDEYAFADDEDDANTAAEENISESVWAFNASFLVDYMPEGMTIEAIDLIKLGCESANEPLKALIEDWDEFVEDAIAADGRGHFLAPYDFEEHEGADSLWSDEQIAWIAVQLEWDVENLNEGLLYQIN